MGDRYTLTISSDQLEKRYETQNAERHEPRYNVAPTQIMPALTMGSDGFSFFYWGQIPERAKNRSISSKLLFADAESLLEKPSSKSALSQKRCIIPADGFYDWKRISKKGRVPYRWTFPQHNIVSFAGLWEEFDDEEDNNFHTFKILTVKANADIAIMNTRMPAILNKSDEQNWLNPLSDPAELTALLQPFPAGQMESYTVSPRIDDPDNEGPTLIRPEAPADQFGNYSLFD